MASTWLRALDDLEGVDLPLVGGKAFRLALLKQNGFNVPPGLVVTTHFFETQIRHAKLTPLWAGSPDIAVTAEALNWLADSLKITPLAPPLAQALNRQLEAVFGSQAGNFAVRSSVIDEDQRDHTFAGLHLTELGVPRGALLIAITRCWASALHGPAIEYRQAHGMSIQSIKVAVLIQPLLRPSSAGVAFSINPLTGARDEMVIEATWGLADRLVSGKTQPYFYRLANQPPHYPLLEQRPGDAPPAGPEQPDPNGPLSPRQVAEMAHQLGQIQALMGQPQDVEWAWQGETLFVLQTRPVAGPPEPAHTLDREWLRLSHLESLPELPSPLFGSLLERSQIQLIHFFKSLGFAIENSGPLERLILGRPYLNLTLIKKLFARLGLHPDNFLQAIGYPKTTQGRIFAVDWRAARRALGLYLAIFKRLAQLRPYLEASLAKINEACASLRHSNLNAPRDNLLNQLQQQDKIYGLLALVNLNLVMGQGVLVALGRRLLAPITPAPATVLRMRARRGLKPHQLAYNQALIRLGQMAGRSESLKNLLDNLPPKAALPDPLPPEFEPHLNNFLTQYGQRAAFEMDPAWPRYGEMPATLLPTLQQVVKNRASPNPGFDEQMLLASSAGFSRMLPWRRWLAQPLVILLRRQLLWQDMLDSARAEAMAACRHWNLALGARWAGKSWLAQPEDIFWLTLQEIEQAIMLEQNAAVSLSSTVQARKESYHGYAKTKMPLQLKEAQLPYIQMGVGLSSKISDEVIIGLPVSPGQARGKVVVMRRPEALSRQFEEDIILVMPSTDPAWLAQLHLACGLIVETGGLLSHGSIIAREYGLPAVANIPRATQRFHTGDTVLVDGSTGVVQLLEAAPAA